MVKSSVPNSDILTVRNDLLPCAGDRATVRYGLFQTDTLLLQVRIFLGFRVGGLRTIRDTQRVPRGRYRTHCGMQDILAIALVPRFCFRN